MKDSKKIAVKRMEKAEALLYRAAELIEAAQNQLSVLIGTNANYTRMGNLREKVKSEMYALESVRAVGHVMADEQASR